MEITFLSTLSAKKCSFKAHSWILLLLTHLILKIYHNKVLCYGTLDFNCSIIALFLYKFSDVVLSFYDFSMAKVGHKIFWAHNRHDYDLQSGNVKFNKEM